MKQESIVTQGVIHLSINEIRFSIPNHFNSYDCRFDIFTCQNMSENLFCSTRKNIFFANILKERVYGNSIQKCKVSKARVNQQIIF